MNSENDDLANHPDLMGSEWADRIARIEKQHARRQRWSSRNRRMRQWIPVTAVLMVVLGAWIAFNRPNFGAVGVPSSGQPSTTSTKRAPETVRVNLAMPFLNTPAAGWADGAEGFAAPAPAPVGRFDADTVAAAYDRTRQALITARVDRATLLANDTARVLSLFAPKFREYAEKQIRDTPEDGKGMFVTALAPGQQLLPAQPKVNGTMAAQVNAEGDLAVHTNYVVAYAFDPGNPQKVRQAMDIVVVQRWEIDYTFVGATDGSGRPYAAESQGIWLRNGQGHTYAVDCSWARKGFLAPAFGNGYGLTPPEHNSDYYFDPTHSIPTTDGCH